jgi:Ca2+-binding EF-hand superfamily protein
VPYTEFQALLGRGGSIFGQALLEALEDRFARADANHDGRLTVAELEAYLKARLPEKLALARKLEVVKEFTQEPQSFVTPRQRPLPLAQGK